MEMEEVSIQRTAAATTWEEVWRASLFLICCAVGFDGLDAQAEAGGDLGDGENESPM